MKDYFSSFFSLDDNEVSKIWNEGLFVLDANVLLNFYRFSEETCNEMFNLFSLLGDRLWIPHRVAQEYFNNRLSVVGEQVKIYSDSIREVASFQERLEDAKRHPFVSGKTLVRVKDVFSDLSKEFDFSRSKHEARIYNDEIKSQVAELLSGKVGRPYSNEELEAFIKEGVERYKQKKPPGYKDKVKSGESPSLADRCKPYGDYIIWRQIIDKAKQDDKSVVFITNDNKEDWWLRYSGKTISPLPELVEEFSSLTGKLFHMYTQLSFLERAHELLGVDVSVSMVDEVREVNVEEDEVVDLMSSVDELSRGAPIQPPLYEKGYEFFYTPPAANFFQLLTLRENLLSLDKQKADLEREKFFANPLKTDRVAEIEEELHQINLNIHRLAITIADVERNYLDAGGKNTGF